MQAQSADPEGSYGAWDIRVVGGQLQRLLCLDCMSGVATEWRGSLKGPWEFVALWAFCLAPKSVGSFLGKGRVLFSISWVPPKQGFQRRILGPGARITHQRLGFGPMGMPVPPCGLLVQLPRGLVGKGSQAEGHNAFLCPAAPPEWVWSHGPCTWLPL